MDPRFPTFSAAHSHEAHLYSRNLAGSPVARNPRSDGVLGARSGNSWTWPPRMRSSMGQSSRRPAPYM
eukprot:1428992-Prymnesium_polylepis.2